jgi:hypothetical protein
MEIEYIYYLSYLGRRKWNQMNKMKKRKETEKEKEKMKLILIFNNLKIM